MQLVWNPLDDTSPLGKTILSKLSTVIDDRTEGKGFLSFSVMSKEELDLLEDLWHAVKIAY